MNETGEQIANECLTAIRAAIELCETCPDQRWQAVTAEEGWPVSAVVRHIAEAGGILTGFAEEMAAGRDVTTTMAEIDAFNLAHVDEWKTTTRAEAMVLLREAGEAAARAVRSYDEDQLAGVHNFAIYGEPRTTGRMARGFALHTIEHLDSARAAIAAEAIPS